MHTILGANGVIARERFRALAGIEVAYLVAGLGYSASVWEDQWPRVMQSVMDACRRHQARLVFLDNVYAYGRVDGAMAVLGLFVPVIRENREMMYQMEHDYRFDSRRIELEFGLQATGYQEGIGITLDPGRPGGPFAGAPPPSPPPPPGTG